MATHGHQRIRSELRGERAGGNKTGSAGTGRETSAMASAPWPGLMITPIGYGLRAQVRHKGDSPDIKETRTAGNSCP